MFETELLSYLKSVSALTTLVGNRIYTEAAPQGAVYPFLIYSEVSETPDYVMSGQRSSLVEKCFQFDCYATTRSGARAVRDALRSALSYDNCAGDWGSPPTIHMNGAFLELSEHTDKYEPDPKVPRITEQYKFLYNLL
jgi:hypothetical protein